MSKKYVLNDGTNFSIRVASASDASKLINYLNTIASESDNLTFGPGEMNATIEQEQKFIEDANKTSNQLFIIAIIDGLVIGNLNFSGGKRPRVSHTGEFGVSVLKEYWGNGIAFELISYLITWAAEGGIITKLNLRVREDNKNAIKLYKKLGFKKEGLITRDFFIKGEYFNSYQMGLEIG